MRRMLIVGALIALCFGCATVVVRERPDNPAAVEVLLESVRGVTVQAVSGAWKDEAFVAECVLKGDGERLSAVLLAPQMRLATLTMEKPCRICWERSPQVPSTLDPEYVILNLALVLLPADKLAKALGDGYRIDETADGKRRTVFDVNRGELQSVRQILPTGELHFRNVVYGYEFTVKTVAHED